MPIERDYMKLIYFKNKNQEILINISNVTCVIPNEDIPDKKRINIYFNTHDHNSSMVTVACDIPTFNKLIKQDGVVSWLKTND